MTNAMSKLNAKEHVLRDF